MIIDNPGNMFAQPYYNLGNIYRDRGDIVKAEELYTQAIARDKNFPFSYQNLAAIYVNRGDLIKGAEMLEIVKQLKPSDPRTYYNLGLIYNAQNNKEKAIQNLSDGLTFIQGDATIETVIRNLLSNISQTITK